jgi:outer membrane protein assembly factor BamB
MVRRALRGSILLLLLLPGPGTALTPAPPAPLQLQRQWRFGISGFNIGAAGILVTDINGDGKPEIVLSTRGQGYPYLTDYWYILRWNASSGAFETSWVSDLAPGQITTIAAFDVDGSGIKKIFVGTDDSKVRVFDGRSLKQVGEIDMTSGGISRVLYGDADNDGSPEIVVSDGTKTVLCSPSTLAVKRTIPYGGDVALANVDTDPAKELVYLSGHVVQLTTSTLTEKWNYGAAFGIHMQVADLDGDGVSEIVGSANYTDINCFNAVTKTIAWNFKAAGQIGALLVVDVDGGNPEVLFGDGSGGSLHCLDAATRAEKWAIPDSDSGFTNIAYGDADGDGIPELLYGCGNATSSQDLFKVYSMPSRTLKWKSEEVDGPFVAMDVGDVDGDGRPELVFCSYRSESSYMDGVLYILDAATKQLKWKSPHNLFLGQAWTGVHSLRIGDVDGDGIKDIVVGTDDLYDGTIYVIDGVTHAVKASYKLDKLTPINAVDVADVDKDGHNEIIAGGICGSGTPAARVYILDGATGVEKWVSGDLSTSNSQYIREIHVADVDGDGIPDIVAISDHVTIINGVTHAVWTSSTGGYTSLDLADVNGDGIPDVILGNGTGGITVLRGDTHATILSFSAGSGLIEQVRIADLDGDGIQEAVVLSLGMIGIYGLDGSVAGSPPGSVGYLSGMYGRMMLFNINGGANLEILAGSVNGVTQYGVSRNGDSDNDGLPDAWEEQYFGAGNIEAVHPTDDPDGDGFNNAAEAAAGTDPMNPTSVPTGTGGGAGSGDGGGGGGGGGCGLTGLDAGLLALLLAGARRQVQKQRRPGIVPEPPRA